MIDRIANVRVLVVLTLLALLFPLVLFPATGFVGNMPLDLNFSYSPEQVHGYLEALGANGRVAYARMELTTDLLFPVLYSLALTVALVMAGRRAFPASRLQRLFRFPLLIVIADWCENLSLARVIDAFPDRLDGAATVASLFTSLKWTLIILTIMTLFVVCALLVIKR
jgi:hypothetical protein